MTYPTVKCPVCSKHVMLTPKGRLPEHSAGAFRCSGSGVSYPKLKEQHARKDAK